MLIRNDLRAGENYGMYLSIAMSKYAGEETKIVGVRVMPSGRETYYLDIDKGNFLWTSEMFEPKVENNFEKAKSKHEELLKEREEENRKMELQQIEENLKGISELVNRLYEELEKYKQAPKNECKYQLNVFIAKPMTGENVWWINDFGKICHGKWTNGETPDKLYFNSNLFKDKESAETYIDLLNDMKRLSKKFEFEDDDVNLRLTVTFDETVMLFDDYNFQARDYYFTPENGEYIIAKYGQEVLRNFIRYCK